MRVALFVTCLNDTLFPEVGRATVEVLRRVGLDVEFPIAQTCCGQMHLNSGYRSEALAMLRRFVEAFSDYDLVVAPSASCAATVRHHYPHLAEAAPGAGSARLATAVADLAPRVVDLSEALLDVVGTADVGSCYPHRVAYHTTCHSLRLLQIGDRPLRLLRAVKDLELVDIERSEQCCGFGGTFSIKNAETSAAMAADKVAAVKASGAEVLTATDTSCLMHLGGSMARQHYGIRTVHLAEILASTGPGTR